jgi:hypothetical protein
MWQAKRVKIIGTAAPEAARLCCLLPICFLRRHPTNLPEVFARRPDCWRSRFSAHPKDPAHKAPQRVLEIVTFLHDLIFLFAPSSHLS